MTKIEREIAKKNYEKVLANPHFKLSIINNGLAAGHDDLCKNKIFLVEKEDCTYAFLVREDSWSYEYERDSPLILIDKPKKINAKNILEAMEKSNKNATYDEYDKFNDSINDLNLDFDPYTDNLGTLISIFKDNKKLV